MLYKQPTVVRSSFWRWPYVTGNVVHTRDLYTDIHQQHLGENVVRTIAMDGEILLTATSYFTYT